MRILIQDPGSHFFFNGRRWIDDEKGAIEFENVARAEEFCQKEFLAGALIVVKFNDGLDNVCYSAGSQNSAPIVGSPG